MKLTKSRLRYIIREEIRYLFEVAEKEHEKEVPIDISKKESQDGIYVDLVSLVKLIVGEERELEVRGIDQSSGSRPQPMSLSVSKTNADPVDTLAIAQNENMDKVFVPSSLYGRSFNIAHPLYGKYNFIVEH
tara:strand:+ start:886 stop:1281 length:396 start_codon:yes stop_codon:yes gene_type:complete